MFCFFIVVVVVGLDAMAWCCYVCVCVAVLVWCVIVFLLSFVLRDDLVGYHAGLTSLPPDRSKLSKAESGCLLCPVLQLRVYPVDCVRLLFFEWGCGVGVFLLFVLPLLVSATQIEGGCAEHATSSAPLCPLLETSGDSTDPR